MVDLIANVACDHGTTNNEATCTSGEEGNMRRWSGRSKSSTSKRIGLDVGKGSRLKFTWVFLVILVAFDKAKVETDGKYVKIVLGL